MPSHSANPASTYRIPLAKVDAILQYLTDRQHLRPHAPVLEVLKATVDQFGCCPAAIDRGIAWLGIEPGQLIGRLRRTELVQLSNAIHRFWTQNLNVIQSAT